MSSRSPSVRRAPAKRLRIARACDACRKRKSKCDGGQPTCAICDSAGRRCSYNNTTARRGLQPGYVRALEGLLGLMIEIVPESESTVRSTLQKSTGKSGFPRGALAEKGVDVWRSSRLAAHVDRLLQRLDGAEDEDDGFPSAEEEDETQDQDTSVPVGGGLWEEVIQRGSVFGASQSDNSQKTTSAGLQSAHLLDGSFPSTVHQLVDLYFTYTQCWLPIVERRDILRIVHTDRTAESSASTPNNSKDRGLVWAICAYSLYSAPKPVNVDVVVDPTCVQTYIQSQIGLYGGEGPTITEVQALLILVLLHLGLGSVHNAWILLAQAARMLLILDRAPKPRPGRFQHVFHACVLLDHITSTSLRRRPCFTLQDQDSPEAIDEDGLEEWETWPGLRNICNTPTGASPSPSPLRSLSTLNLVSRLTDGSDMQYQDSSEPCVETRIQHLLHWRANLPADRRHAQGVPFRITTLTLHLIWGFFLSSTIASSPATRVSLALDVARSTLDMVNTYIQGTGSAGSSPLLPVCAFQALACLQTVPSAQITSAVSDTKSQLEELVTQMRGHWNAAAAAIELTNTETLTNAPPLISNMYQPTTELQDPHGSDNRMAPLALAEAALSVRVDSGDQLGDSNDFDSLFEEMAASMPSTRSTTEPLFAHNLGFIADGWNSDFLSFLQQPLEP